MNSKRVALLVLLVIVIVSTMSATAIADITVTCRTRVCQDKFPYATDLHLKAWQKEDVVEIKSWGIGVTGAYVDHIDSVRGSQPVPYNDLDNGMHAVDIDIDFTPPGVAEGEFVQIDTQLHLTSFNTQRIADLKWTYGEEEAEISPSHGWSLGPPILVPSNPTVWTHAFEIGNDDVSASLMVKCLEVAVRDEEASMDALEDLQAWDAVLVDSMGYVLTPGDSLAFIIPGPAGSPADSQHIWGHYEIWSHVPGRQGSKLMDAWFDHYDFVVPWVGVDDPGGHDVGGSKISLAQNTPNPFGTGTEIACTTLADGDVTLMIYNAAGQRVTTLIDEWRRAGQWSASWDGRDESGRDVGSGVYFCRLQLANQVTTEKLIVLR